MTSQSQAVDNKDFNYPNADVILVSVQCGDDAIRREFRVHKLILSLASPIFETMFTLPQSDPAQIQTIECPETEETLDLLLRYIYPVPDPTTLNLTQVSDGLNAAMKYEAARAMTALRALLTSVDFLKQYPIGAYAITSRHGFEAECKIALKATLQRRIFGQPFEGEFEYLDARALYSLINFHNKFFKFVSSSFKNIFDDDNRDCQVCTQALRTMAASLEKDMREANNVDMTNSNNLLTSLEHWASASCTCDHLQRQNMSSYYETSCTELKRHIETFGDSDPPLPPLQFSKPSSPPSIRYNAHKKNVAWGF